jgi:hypothetical protein
VAGVKTAVCASGEQIESCRNRQVGRTQILNACPKAGNGNAGAARDFTDLFALTASGTRQRKMMSVNRECKEKRHIP